MSDITQADLDAAQAAMENAKKADRPARAAEFADLRRRWRLQEEDAGRRLPGPSGGDS